MIRLAIVGTGGMAEYHAKRFRAQGNVKIVACADRKGENARRFAAEFGIPRWYDSMAGLLDGGGIDAVSCAVSDAQHGRICSLALGRGLDLFAEKPLARTLSDADAIAKAALAAPRRPVVVVNFSKRNAPALRLMRELVAEGALGRVRTAVCSYSQGWVASRCWGDWLAVPRWRWRLSSAESTAGVAGDLGSHCVDALRYVLGPLEPAGRGTGLTLAEAMREGRIPRSPLPDDLVASSIEPGAALVSFSGALGIPGSGEGAGAEVRVSWIDPEAEDRFILRVVGDSGVAELDLSVSRDSVRLLGPDGEPKELPGPRGYSTYAEFVGAMEGRGSDAPGLDDGREALRLLDGMLPAPLARGVTCP